MRNLSSIFPHVGKSYIPQFQDPIRLLEHSKPELDLALLKWRGDNYRDGHSQAKDILLLIEISDSSLAYDRTTKLSLHAQAGIPQYWIINLQEDLIEVYQYPKGDTYLQEEKIAKDESLSLVSLGIQLEARDIWG